MIALVFKTRNGDGRPVFRIIPFSGEDAKIPGKAPAIVKDVFIMKGLLVGKDCKTHSEARAYLHRAGGRRLTS